MAIIATVRDGLNREVAKFVPANLATFEGSAGFGGIGTDDPISSAKTHILAQGGGVGCHILAIDTQSPVGSSTHSWTIRHQGGRKWREEGGGFKTNWER